MVNVVRRGSSCVVIPSRLMLTQVGEQLIHTDLPQHLEKKDRDRVKARLVGWYAREDAVPDSPNNQRPLTEGDH